MFVILCFLPFVRAADAADAAKKASEVAAESLRTHNEKSLVKSKGNDAGEDLEQTAEALDETQSENAAVAQGVKQTQENADELIDALDQDRQVAQANANAYDMAAKNINAETSEDGASVNPQANNMAAGLNEQKGMAKEMDEEATEAMDKLNAVSVNAQTTVEAHEAVLQQLKLGIDRLSGWTQGASHSVNALGAIISALTAAVNSAEGEMVMITQTLTVLGEKLTGDKTPFTDKIEDITLERVGKVDEQQKAEQEALAEVEGS